MIKEITSVQNELIKNFLTLKTKKEIIKSNSCFVESEKIILDLINIGLNPKKIFILHSKISNYENIINNYKNITYSISDNIANKLSETVTTSGIFAEFELPKQKMLDCSKKFLVLDNLQDPSNLGAIIRSALAFGYEQIIMIGGVFPYLPKVIRSSMGYVFGISFIYYNVEELKAIINRIKIPLISANLNGCSISKFKVESNFGLVIGNEGNGVSDEVQKLCNYTVTIPMNKKVESLNASISASILMYLLK